ncbi:SIMPL domain-containing protein [Mannheimia bovis]|uniref:SIMPL domain-containing protein n=1 Tax=Mannheimia bovis TaxID=2770636 RepID=A0A7H1C326_9PAST|nr:SIMPL domain-containing protein [Mannheimia bovis]QNS15381.1 SIMPL domain-containing protein [Mannheimia bovis]
MKLKNFFTILPLALTTITAFAETATTEAATAGTVVSVEKKQASNFSFSTKVTRSVEQDLMQATVYSQKSGKSLPELKKSVSQNLNQVIETAKKHSAIEVQAEGISNNANYNNKGNIDGWQAYGSVSLKSKDFNAMAEVLENLGKDVAIQSIYFGVSPEKVASLEEEMLLEVIKKFQAKAEIIQKALGAKQYRLSMVNLQTPSDGGYEYGSRMASAMYAAEKAAMGKSADMPLEAGKTTISASASGSVDFE